MKFAYALCAALTCAAWPAWAVPVSVTVVGPDNKPLPDAKLRWFEAQYARDAADKATDQPGVAGVFAWNWAGDFADKRPDEEKRFLRVRAEAPGMTPQVQLIKQGQTTIALQKARDWSGVVLDQNQKPVAGAQLKLSEVKPPDVTAEDYSTFVEVSPQTATTDAQGRWNFSGLPARGTAQLALIAPGFARQRLKLTLGEGDAAPIYAKPGGTIKGQLLKPDGAPIVGETVEAGFGVDNQTVTDAQGRFTLEGVEPGRALISIGELFGKQEDRTLPPYVLERLKSVPVEAEKTADMGAIKAQNGVLLRARVIDADSKKPVADARFRIGYNDVPNVVITDGSLQSRVAPSKGRRGGFERPKIESKGYVDYELPLKALDAEGEFDLGTITMQRGTVIRGTVRMENGDPKASVVLPGISFSRDNKYDFVRVASDGQFESDAHQAGSYSVNMNGGNGDWQIVSPRTVSVPEFGTEMKALEIVVKRLTPILPPIKTARGRVVDENGQGVAGVTIRARLTTEGGGSYTNGTATTDKDGAFTLNGDERTVGVEIDSAEHPSFLVGGVTEVKVADGIATISGLVAKKRGAVYSSHVVGADGQPAKNAWVTVVEARDYAPVQTDENGQFDLPDVPLTQFTLVAAQGRDWARQAVRSDAPGAALQLRNSGAVVERARLLDQLVAIKSGVSSDTLFAAWDVLGADGIERFVRRNGEPSREVMAMFGAQLARRDPAQFLVRAPQLLQAAEGEAREDLEAQLNIVRAASDDAGERTDANAWLDEQKQLKREIKPRSVLQLLQMAVVARELGREDAGQWLDYAAAVAGQLKGGAENNAFAWREVLSRLSYDDLARFVEGRGAVDEFQTLAYVTPALARAGDVKGAQRALARLETLLKTPEIAQLAEQASKQSRVPPTGTVEAARSAIAVALAPNDPLAAWMLAQKVEDTYRRLRAMTGVAAGAQKAGNAEIAEKAVRDVMKARTGNIEFYALAASIGARVSPQLGDELFAAALEKSLPADKRDPFSPPSIGMWAFYHAPTDAAQSRVLIEREWDWRLPAAIKTKNDSFSSDLNALNDLVKGMTAVDLARAAEMQAQVDAIGAKNYGRGVSQFGIAVLQLATPEQRASLGVDLSMDY